MTQDAGRVRSRDEIVAEEDLVIDVQFLIQDLLDERGMTRADLAGRLGISKARLSQLMRPEANPTLRSVARILHALDDRAVLTAKSRDSADRRSSEQAALGATSECKYEGLSRRLHVETGAEADLAYFAIDGRFNRAWCQAEAQRPSNDSYLVMDDQEFELAAA